MLLIRVFDRGKKELLLLLLASTVALKRGVNPTTRTTFIRQKEGWISDKSQWPFNHHKTSADFKLPDLKFQVTYF